MKIVEKQTTDLLRWGMSGAVRSRVGERVRDRVSHQLMAPMYRRVFDRVVWPAWRQLEEETSP